MALTTKDALERLLLLDECLLLEVLDIDAEELLSRFEDKLIDKLDEIEQHLEEL